MEAYLIIALVALLAAYNNWRLDRRLDELEDLLRILESVQREDMAIEDDAYAEEEEE